MDSRLMEKVAITEKSAIMILLRSHKAIIKVLELRLKEIEMAV